MTTTLSRRPVRDRVLGVRPERLLAGAVLASVLLKWTVGGVALVDGVLLIGTSILAGSRADRVSVLARRSLLPLWLFALGSAIALRPVGFAGWALVTMLTDVFVLVAFFAVYRVASRLDDRQWRVVLLASAAAAAAVAVSIVVVGQGYRPSGTFDNPNYTAHWMAVASLFVVCTWQGVMPRALAIGAAGLVMIRTGSFGGMALLAAGLFVAAYVHARRPTTHLYWRLLTVVLAVFSLVTFAQAFERFEEDSSVVVNEGVNAARFQGSSELRRQLWDRGIGLFASNPFGVAPHGISNRDLLGRGAEIHNDYLATLIERGAVGAIGLGLFVAVLWRSSKKNGAFRTLLVAAMVAAVFRETLHFRHLWIFLALALAWDEHQQEVAARGSTP